MISNNIFFAYDDEVEYIHPKLLENVDFVRQQNPSYITKIYSRNDFIKLLEKEKPEWLLYFNKLNPNHYSLFSDYVRIVLLYLFGGVYLDIKTRPTKPINDIITNDCKLWLSYASSNYLDIMSPFMMCEKNASFFKRAIDKFHHNIDIYHTLDLNINAPKKNILRLFATYMLKDIAEDEDFDGNEKILLEYKNFKKYCRFSIFNTGKRFFSKEHYKYYNKPHYTKIREHLIK